MTSGELLRKVCATDTVAERFYSLAIGCAARQGENSMLALAAISASRTDPGG